MCQPKSELSLNKNFKNIFKNLVINHFFSVIAHVILFFCIFSNDLVFEYNEFKPRLKSPQNRFQLSAGLNLEKCNTILSGSNHI